VPQYDGYGAIVLVDMGHGLEALYAYLSVVGVKVGDPVVAGQEARPRWLHGLVHGDAPAFRAARPRRGLRSGSVVARYNPVREGG